MLPLPLLVSALLLTPGENEPDAYTTFRDHLYAEGRADRRPLIEAARRELDELGRRFFVEQPLHPRTGSSRNGSPRASESSTTPATTRHRCEALRDALHLGHHGRADELTVTLYPASTTATRRIHHRQLALPQARGGAGRSGRAIRRIAVSELVAHAETACKLSPTTAIGLFRAFGLEPRAAPLRLDNHAPRKALFAFEPPRERLPPLPANPEPRALRIALSLPQQAFVESFRAGALDAHETLSYVELTLSDPDRHTSGGPPAIVFERSVRFVELEVVSVIDRYYCEAGTPRATARCGTVTYRYEEGELVSVTPTPR